MELNGAPMLSNVWLGVSAENQQAVDERIPILLEIPAAVRFVSIEPMLQPVDLVPWLGGRSYRCSACGWHRTERELLLEGNGATCLRCDNGHLTIGNTLDWVIVGGESGPGARPMHPDWARSVRDQCLAAGVPFFFKQWGAWKPNSYPAPGIIHLELNGRVRESATPTSHSMLCAGKKAAGRLLDGRYWNEMPEMGTQ